MNKILLRHSGVTKIFDSEAILLGSSWKLTLT